jgi:hypothetical protein
LKVAVEAVDCRFIVVADISRFMLCAACLMAICLACFPDATVTVADLGEKDVFAVADTVIVLLPFPEEGDTEHHG